MVGLDTLGRRLYEPMSYNRARDFVARLDRGWMESALCRSAPESFYPPPSDNVAAREARAICALCSVKEACLEYALNFERPNERYGIWGGTTPLQRELAARPEGRTA